MWGGHIQCRLKIVVTSMCAKFCLGLLVRLCHSSSAILDMYFTMNDKQAHIAMNSLRFNSENPENRTVPGQSGAHFREALPQHTHS